MTVIYLDTSAYVKTIIEEPESERLRRWLDQRPERTSCALLRTEALGAVRHHGADAVAAARAGLEDIKLVKIDDRLLEAAGVLAADVRALDAIHFAAALEFGPDLDAVVTYDARMQRGAELLGVAVASP